ncbi:MAG: glycosyltransferase, partial [Alphaproteobacteria bacterium]|nr:glycosyltransferase [Alphaproteobacteria bacterium]
MAPVNHLIIFAKTPRMGTVKTRLAADIGLVSATAFARRTLHDVAGRLAKDPRWRCWLAVSPDTAANEPKRWPRVHGLVRQGAGDLGRRMAGVAHRMPTGPVVIIGTDVPAIRPHHIADAFTALGSHDAVFGPAHDGGYWLVGLKRRPVFKDIFQGVRWSTEQALSDTIANLPHRWSHALLETLDDIDD